MKAVCRFCRKVNSVDDVFHVAHCVVTRTVFRLLAPPCLVWNPGWLFGVINPHDTQLSLFCAVLNYCLYRTFHEMRVTRNSDLLVQDPAEAIERLQYFLRNSLCDLKTKRKKASSLLHGFISSR